jgi:chromate reductase, NAD(P)H dehydrogenase (quinone)
MSHETRPLRILGMSGSLRAASSNAAALRAAAALAPEGVAITLYEGLGGLPHFNPDLDVDLEAGGVSLPQPVLDLRSRVQAADGVLISCPEYAHGVPGSFKNALDWLVSGREIVDKPVALINTSPLATWAHASLTEMLRVMSTRLVEEAFVTFPLQGRKLDEAGMLADPVVAGTLRVALAAFARAIRAHPRPL